MTEKKIEAPTIIISDEVGKTAEFKRPDHTDFMDSSELRKMKWSGIRHNQIVDHLEIWKCGVLAASMSVEHTIKFPEKWEQLYEEAFALKRVRQESK